jgi:hypothetical protein
MTHGIFRSTRNSWLVPQTAARRRAPLSSFAQMWSKCGPPCRGWTSQPCLNLTLGITTSYQSCTSFSTGSLMLPQDSDTPYWPCLTPHSICPCARTCAVTPCCFARTTVVLTLHWAELCSAQPEDLPEQCRQQHCSQYFATIFKT